MGLFDRFSSRKPQKAPPKDPQKNIPLANPAQLMEEMAVYSNMRVEVTTLDGHMLFVAKLMYPQGSTAELHQYSEAELPSGPPEEPLHVRIRGYHDRLRKAVYMEGDITPRPKRVWQVDQFVISRMGNERAFFRLDTDLEASVTKFSGRNAGERPCRMLNISVGGARIVSDCQYWEGDKLLLTVKLLEDRDPSVMFCQVLRVIEKEEDSHEYGLQFLELNEADQDKITENIFTAQRKVRKTAQKK